MTLLEMIQTLSNNVCLAHDINPNDLEGIGKLAKSMCRDIATEDDFRSIEEVERIRSNQRGEENIISFKRFDENGNPIEEKKELDVPDFLKNRKKQR